MSFISFSTAIELTERSERTLWRLISDGSVSRELANGKAMVDLVSLRPYLCLPINDEDDDLAMIHEADQGDAAAQTDLALLLLANGKQKGAIYWLELATKQDYPDAMNWLGRCYIEGNGVTKDVNTGLIWIAKAAAQGHVISKAQLDGMHGSFS